MMYRFEKRVKLPHIYLFFICLTMSPLGLFAQFFNANPKSALNIDVSKEYIRPEQGTYATYQLAPLRAWLRNAPSESDFAQKRPGLPLKIIHPDGHQVDFEVYEYLMMEPKLYAEMPNIRTYIAINPLNPHEYGHIDVTEQGFHAMIFSESGTWFVDPASLNNHTALVAYFKHDLRNAKTFICHLEEKGEPGIHDTGLETRNRRTCNTNLTLMTYRAAFACTGEYANFHGGTVALAQSAIVTTVNRVNALYQRDLAVRMILIGNNTSIVYTNANTDPYTNNDGFAMLDENVTTLNNVIGSTNFDVGHVLSTGGGGVAYLRSVCENFKAGGVTGSSQPITDPFDIDYVAHEVGHQFGGPHTFNGNVGSCGGGNRSSNFAYEPGSGSTIMAYAGICGSQNIQLTSDDYFHVSSLTSILDFVEIGSGNNCDANGGVSNTTPLITDFTTGYTIPANTSFYLEASATDADGDPITYAWEQYDLGVAGGPGANPASSPLFRTFKPTASGRRTFPALKDILSNNFAYGEVLPTVARSLNFRITARDNHPGAGGICRQNAAINVVASSGFTITSPNTSVSWPNNATRNITWYTAETNSAPINCTTVNVAVSFDNGHTFTTIGHQVPNSGSFAWAIPADVHSSKVRFKVSAVNNIFFDINNVPMTIGTPSTEPVICQTYTATDVPVTIPSSGASIVSSEIVVNGISAGFVSDINVTNITGTHTDVGDLIIRLVNPQGEKATLLSRRCSGTTANNNNFNLGFSDGANNNVPCPPTTGSLYNPVSPLSALFTNAPNGTWRLEIEDYGPEDGGTLNQWSLEICVEENFVLPVNLIHFQAIRQIESTLLSWVVDKEVNLKEYMVERSKDGIHFQTLAKVKANGQPSYSYTDIQPLPGNNYYRLVAINMDHSIEYSPLQWVLFNGKSALTAFPSPTRDVLFVSGFRSEGESLQVVALDAMGTQVLQERTTTSRLSGSGLSIANLMPGVYTLLVNGGTTYDAIRFVVVE